MKKHSKTPDLSRPRGPSILLIEDDPDIAELVTYHLERDGMVVTAVDDGRAGLEQARRGDFDLILLDLMLPGLDGLTVCRTLRSDGRVSRTPIVILTAKSSERDVVRGLDLGADDYVCKPFRPAELVARVRSIVRRTGRKPERRSGSILTVGPVTIDSDRHQVDVDGQPVALTLAEFRLLEQLMSRPGRTFTRSQLISCIGGASSDLVDRNVDVHIRSIRRKLGPAADIIETVRGVGYGCAKS